MAVMDDDRPRSARDRQAAGAEAVNDTQGRVLAELIRRWKPLGFQCTVSPFDLPEGSLLVDLRLRTGNITIGILPDGSTHS